MKMRLKSRIFAFGFCMVVLLGCSPRGETKSLQEILSTSKERYHKASSVKIDVQVSKNLQEVSTYLKEMEGLAKDVHRSAAMSDLRGKAAEVAKLLWSLDRKAGYTTRPSLAEVANQFHTIATAADQGASRYASRAAVTLLMARTYNLLASELETISFAMSG